MVFPAVTGAGKEFTDNVEVVPLARAVVSDAPEAHVVVLPFGIEYWTAEISGTEKELSPLGSENDDETEEYVEGVAQLAKRGDGDCWMSNVALSANDLRRVSSVARERWSAEAEMEVAKAVSSATLAMAMTTSATKTSMRVSPASVRDRILSLIHI